MEKKRKMEEEKLRRRPPFINFINVKHTGTSPFRKVPPLSVYKPKMHKAEEATILDAPRTRAGKQALEMRKKQQEALKFPSKSTFNFNMAPWKVVPPENNKIPEVKRRITRQTVNAASALPKPVPDVAKKTLRVAQPSSKPVNTRSTKKAETNVKPVIKKELPKKKQLKENKENIPVVNNLACNVKTCQDCGKAKQNSSRSRKKTGSAESSASVDHNVVPTAEPTNGPIFQRMRLQEESAKLIELRTKWLNIEKENILPETIREEILSVTGLTSLLITSKFEQFKSLIDDCAAQLANPTIPQRVVSDDLDGFWEMMFIQVVQLHNKYANLERLMLNNWKDPTTEKKIRPKKSVVKTPMPNKRRTRSRFQDFLNKRKEDKQTEENKPVSSLSETFNTFEDIVAEAQKENCDGETFNLNSLKSCLTTPKAMKNLLTARKSRRSSMNIIMSMSGLGKFDISGTALPSPKLEKKVMFANVD